MDRRQVLVLLASASGSAIAGHDGAQPKSAPLQNSNPVTEGAQMEKVLGIGGLFFRAKDPKALGIWYRDNLGIDLVPSSQGAVPWHTEAGVTVFAPFPKDTQYFGAETQMWMVNFRVRDLDKMAAQLKSKGIEVKIYPEDPTGRFARLHDPEGNPVELWQPKG
jgi:catechol 2,3-dioxygenase-like lactoylglutathione lyase family enzyme